MQDSSFVVRLSAEDTLLHFFDGSLLLNGTWPDGQAESFLQMVLETPYEDLLKIIDQLEHTTPLDTEHIPQFADTVQIDSTVQILVGCCESHLHYADLGYYLLREERNHSAYAKYGENHGKGASLLGLACNVPGEFACSVLTQAYTNIADAEIRRQLRCKLYLRIPLLQDLLYRAKTEEYNGYDSMRMLMLSTMRRRGQSPRKLFKELYATGNIELQKRIDRIFWQE